MAGDMNIKIGADLSELLTKVEAAKAKLNQLTESEQQLKAAVNDLNSSLKQNEAELGKTATQLRKLVDSGKGATVEAKKLRAEIAGLATNSAQLNTSLATTKNQLAATTVQLKAQTIATKQAEVATGGFSKGATKAFSALRSLANIIPGIGIGGLVGLISGPLVEAFEEWWKAIDNVSAASKLLKAQQSDLADIMKDANKEAGSQIADLNLLYTAATNVNLSMSDRLRAAKALNAEFPETFQNFTAEEIALGKAKSAYDATTLAILSQARAKAIKGKLDEIAVLQLDNEYKKEKLLIETGKKLIEIRKSADKVTDVGLGVNVIVTTKQQEAALNASTKLALKQIDLDNQSLEARRKYAADLLDIKTIAPDTGRLKEIDDQIKFLKSQKELHASTFEEVKDFNAKIKALEDERDAIDPPVPKKLRKAAKKAAIVYTETLQHAINELLKDGILPEDFTKGSKRKIDLDIPMPKLREDLVAAGALLNANQEKLDRMAGFVGDTLTPVFDTLFTSILDGSTNAFEAFGNALKGLLVKLAATVAKAAALAAIMAFIFPGSTLGSQGFKALFNKFLGFAEGGEVKGRGSKTSDSIPARLSKGEYVLRASAVDKWGVRLLDQMNQGKAPNFFNSIPKYALGGLVSSPMGSIGGGMAIQVSGRIEARGDKLVTIFDRAQKQIGRNS